jgi:membrane protein
MTSVVAAYYFLLSLFPLVITIGNILPYLNLDVAEILTYLKRLVPSSIYLILRDLIKKLLTNKSGGLLSISALVTLWSGSRSINALQKGINRAYGGQGSNFILSRIISFLVLLLLIFVSVSSVIILGFGQNLVVFFQNKFSLDLKIFGNFQLLSLLILALFIFLIIAVLYYAISNIVITKMRFVFPGAFLAMIGLLILSKIFGMYANYFSRNLSEYQVVGSFIVLMFWLVFSARIIIFGSIFNAIMMDYFNPDETLKKRDQKINDWVKQRTEVELEKLKGTSKFKGHL